MFLFTNRTVLVVNQNQSSIQCLSHYLFSGAAEDKYVFCIGTLDESSNANKDWCGHIQTNPESREEKNILIKLCGYSSAATALLDNHIYCVSGCFIALNSNLTPVLHFDNETVISLGSAENFKGDLADKASVVGFGIVISQNEILEPGTNPNTIRNLIVVLKHTDYDPVSKDQVQFKTEYKISGKKNLANTFGLFQLGREVLISGHISGYNQEQFMWTVNALSVSVASGHQTGLTLANEQSSSVPTQRRRPGL
ncbi:hypothetical protein PGT21_021159 [Puccinia graminis f. sp. tritici]|uniref:Uncharacterized protein n=1 Tax=Puccinia graminis f. sp. tritici TaxID=56615 RepID=A0A5B0QNM7_PUCGR|nr:hypothetical protein PGT21_021159 [Puccinia graminis f. sp. tritici]